MKDWISFRDIENQTIEIRAEDIKWILFPSIIGQNQTCKIFFGTTNTNIWAGVDRKTAVEVLAKLKPTLN